MAFHRSRTRACNRSLASTCLGPGSVRLNGGFDHGVWNGPPSTCGFGTYDSGLVYSTPSEPSFFIIQLRPMSEREQSAASYPPPTSLCAPTNHTCSTPSFAFHLVTGKAT